VDPVPDSIGKTVPQLPQFEELTTQGRLKALSIDQRPRRDQIRPETEASMVRNAAAVLVTIGLLSATGCDKASSPTTPSTNATLPSISIAPSTAIAGSAPIQINISGSGFIGGHHRRSEAVWLAHGQETFLSTTFQTETSLVATIPADLMSEPLAAGIEIRIGDFMAGDFVKSSTVTTFSVLPK
jgi:hypothetical protein